MRRLNFKKNLILVSLLLWGVIKAQETKAFKLSEMSEADRNDKIEEIAFQAIRDNIERIKNDMYYDDPENLPSIDLGPGENYLRWENVEKKIWTQEYIQNIRKIYAEVIKDRNLNVGDILYLAKLTPSKYLVWPITYTVLLFDNGKPIKIGFENNYYFLNIYKNDPIKTLQPPLSPLQLPLKTKRDENTKL